MLSAREKFLLVLSISDEGFEMMLQRVKRKNPGLPDTKIRELLRLELGQMKSRALPKYLIPDYRE